MNARVLALGIPLLFGVGCAGGEEPVSDPFQVELVRADAAFLFAGPGVGEDARSGTGGEAEVAADGGVVPDGGAGANGDSADGTGSGCGPDTCDGCCNAQGLCVDGTGDGLCGALGAACADCTADRGSCQSNRCVICEPDCTGKLCGVADACGGICSAGGSDCCTPLCTGKICGVADGCGGTCAAGSSNCCAPQCTDKLCGAQDGCGAACVAASSDCCAPQCPLTGSLWVPPADGCGKSCFILPVPPKGYLDTVSAAGSVRGWACDSNHPWSSIKVQIFVGGTSDSDAPMYEVYANMTHEAPVTQVCGAGAAHRFAFTLPTVTSGTKVYAYGVNIFGGSDALLANSPMAIP